MKKQTDTFKRLRAVIKDINGDNRQIIKTMQDQIEYLMEFIAKYSRSQEDFDKYAIFSTKEKNKDTDAR